MREKIKGKIVRIIDRKTVIINLGLQDGIESDSVFHILGDPETITDPETNEVLGSVKVAKGRVRASQVFDKFTIASTHWTQVKDTYSGVFRDLLGGIEPIDEGDLNVRQEDLRPWKAKSASPVRVGDEVEVTVVSEPEETEEATGDDTEDGEQSALTSNQS